MIKQIYTQTFRLSGRYLQLFLLPRNENYKRKYESPTWNFPFLTFLNLGKIIGFGVNVVWIKIINWSNVTLNTFLLCNPVFSSSCWPQRFTVRIKWNLYVKMSTTTVFLKDFFFFFFWKTFDVILLTVQHPTLGLLATWSPFLLMCCLSGKGEVDHKEGWVLKNLMLLNCGAGEDSWESHGLHGDQTIYPKGNRPWIFIGRTDTEAKLQYFGHLMQRMDSLEKTLMLGKIEGKRRRGRWQRMKWLESITKSVDMNLSKLW